MPFCLRLSQGGVHSGYLWGLGSAGTLSTRGTLGVPGIVHHRGRTGCSLQVWFQSRQRLVFAIEIAIEVQVCQEVTTLQSGVLPTNAPVEYLRMAPKEQDCHQMAADSLARRETSKSMLMAASFFICY